MIKGIFSDVGFVAGEKQLDASALRQKVISNNISNVNTPGFKKSDVTFEEKLNQAMNLDGSKLGLVATNEKHFAFRTGRSSVGSVEPEIVTDGSTSMRQDENNVDIDIEMANLAKNNISYQTMTRLIGTKFGMISSAISEGRR